MATINLLPPQLVLKGRDKVVVESLKKFVFAGFLLLIVASLVIAAYLIYLSTRIRSSVTREEVLKSEINSLEQTEQGLVLIKDRISKIKSVYALESADSQIETLVGFLQATPGDYRILEIQLSAKGVVLNVVFPSSDSFGAFYKALIEAKLYSSVTLRTFSLSPALGYVASFELFR